MTTFYNEICSILLINKFKKKTFKQCKSMKEKWKEFDNLTILERAVRQRYSHFYNKIKKKYYIL